MNKLSWPNDGGDEEVARTLGAMYAAPVNEQYWNDLEARIVARIAEVDLGWWAELDRWARPALLAAAVLVLAAGVAMFRAHQSDTESAYEELFQPTPVPGAPVEAAAVQRPPQSQEARDNVLRFILTH